MWTHIGLIALGFAVGAIGTLIGVGGGFILIPVLLLLYPGASPETITSISLAVIFVNALSGSVAYARMGRIDYKSGLLFAIAAVPGAVAGALTTDQIPRRLFNLIFGLLMILSAAYLLLRRTAESAVPATADPRLFSREVVEQNGTRHRFSYDLKRGMGLSVFVGYVSSLLGIGGGIIHVPALVRLLNFPVHLATATSHFILAIVALTGTAVHVATGSFANGGVWRTVYLSTGALVGAQVGAALSSRVHGSWIIRGLAIALAMVGLRILATALNL